MAGVGNIMLRHYSDITLFQDVSLTEKMIFEPNM